jgi:hypothetical protein
MDFNEIWHNNMCQIAFLFELDNTNNLPECLNIYILDLLSVCSD